MPSTFVWVWKLALFQQREVSSFLYGLKTSGPLNGSGALKLYIGLMLVTAMAEMTRSNNVAIVLSIVFAIFIRMSIRIDP